MGVVVGGGVSSPSCLRLLRGGGAGQLRPCWQEGRRASLRAAQEEEEGGARPSDGRRAGRATVVDRRTPVPSLTRTRPSWPRHSARR